MSAVSRKVLVDRTAWSAFSAIMTACWNSGKIVIIACPARVVVAQSGLTCRFHGRRKQPKWERTAPISNIGVRSVLLSPHTSGGRAMPDAITAGDES